MNDDHVRGHSMMMMMRHQIAILSRILSLATNHHHHLQRKKKFKLIYAFDGNFKLSFFSKKKIKSLTIRIPMKYRKTTTTTNGPYG